MFVLQREGAAAYDLARLSYLGSMGRDAYGIAVAAGSPLHSIADLRALSARQPIRFTTTGREGTAFAATVIAMHLLGLRGRFITGYRGSNDYVVAAIRGDGDAVVATLPLLHQMQQGGLLRVLASFETHSSIEGAEDATSLGQPGLSAIVIERIVAAPPGLPAALQTRLAAALAAAQGEPSVRAWAQAFGTELVARTPAEAAAEVAAQAQFYQTWKPELDAA
jgi:tripartite-type tricarboxylate transporter receptor subunit TctC